MRTALFIFIIFIIACINDAFAESEEMEWGNFKGIYNKKFERQADEKRSKQYFRKRYANIVAHNKLYAKGIVSYKKSLNKYSDLSHEQFVMKMNGFRRELGPPNNKPMNPFYLKSKNLPAKVDWRITGAVRPIQDQDTCGSCWAFASAAIIESYEFLANQRTVGLSEQNLLDCAKSNMNLGCLGGHMINAYEYVKNNSGLQYRALYPYQNKKSICRYQPNYAGAHIVGYERLPSGGEDILKQVIASVGPVAVGIDGDLDSLQDYSGGIYYDPECSSTNLTHAVVVIGYGTQNDLDYWLIKNSWGVNWGEKGYFKLARNKNNHCGVATDGSFPVI